MGSAPELPSPKVTLRQPLLSLRNVTKIYGQQLSAVCALDGVDMDVEPGEFVAITGASGSGKSTAMSILGCLELPSDGEYCIEGYPVQNLAPDVLAALRNERFGFVFQTFNLLPRTSALENVALPLAYAGVGSRERTKRAAEALALVGLTGREDARSNQLSGGQQQRVAIARAIVNEPEIILADEPTGNLDSRMGAEIMQLLIGLNRERGITILMVTHDPNWAAYAPRQVVFKDGHILSDDRRADA
ncbi:MAG TPA: ABC transporter ATP-binding protein [Micropepsaceae bacterium]|nr:ABC transporter ATP-binding protein [Micropepsaceae bacterium]